MLRKIVKSLVEALDQNLFRWIVKLAYPQYRRPRRGYMTHYQVLADFFFMQKVVGINRRVPWPVDFRSKVRGWQYIKKGIMCDPGDNVNVYINAFGGLTMGDNVGIGPGSVVVTTNHDKYDHRKTGSKKGITIGNNVWVGANCVLLPGICIGDEVTIGAGCIVDRDIPAKTTVKRGPNGLEFYPKRKDYQWDIYAEQLT